MGPVRGGTSSKPSGSIRYVYLLTQHAYSYICLRRFPEALRNSDQILNIAPDDVDTLATKAGIAQAEGDLARASASALRI